jgi:hypothetical protein
METIKIKLHLLLFLFLIHLTSCDVFESTTVSSEEIKKASSWSSKDQAPSYPECESLSKKEQLECFERLISEGLTAYISNQNLVATTPIEAMITLKLKVDKEGIISLLEADISNSLLEALPYLESTLEEAVNNLPTALPATKTNVGVYVDAQFSLPVQIRAQPFE